MQRDGRIADALATIVRDAGPEVIDDPRRIQAMLVDLLGTDTRSRRAEVDAVVLAVEESIPADLVAGRLGRDGAVARLHQRGIDVDVARSAVDSWGVAVGRPEAEPVPATSLDPGPTGGAEPALPSRPQGTPLATPVAMPPTPPTAPTAPVRRRRNVALAAAVTAALVLGTATLAALWLRDDEPPGDARPATTRAGSERTTTAPRATTGRGNVDGSLRLGHLTIDPSYFSGAEVLYEPAIQFAIDEINAAGGVLGQPVSVTQIAEGVDASAVGAALGQLLEVELVDAVLGPSTNPRAIDSVEPLRDARVVACSGATTASALTGADSGGFFFRTAPPDRLGAIALAELVVEDGHAQVGMLVRDDADSRALADVVAEHLEAGGVSIVSDGALQPDPASIATAVGSLLDGQPDAVIAVAYADEVADVVTSMLGRGAAPSDLPVYGTDRMWLKGLGSLVDPSNPAIVEGITGTMPSGAAADRSHPFTTAFPGKDFSFAAYYDCTILIALAAVAAGSDDPLDLREVFERNLSGDTACASFARCSAALERGESIRYQGASPHLGDWRGSEPVVGVYDVWTYGPDGNPRVVRQVTATD